jgi:hypothetical protein
MPGFAARHCSSQIGVAALAKSPQVEASGIEYMYVYLASSRGATIASYFSRDMQVEQDRIAYAFRAGSILGSPEFHERLAMAAQAQGKSFNSLALDALERSVIA